MTASAQHIPANLLRCMSPADQRACSPTGRTPEETRAKAVAKDERELQRMIANWLRLQGLWFTQSRMDRRTSNTVGTPDFIFPYCGCAIYWEVKCPWPAKLRPEQEAARDAILKQGGEWRLVTSLDEAREHLRAVDGRDEE